MSYGAEITPARRLVPVTPGNNNLDGLARSLWIGAEGTISVTDSDGTLVSGIPVQPGVFPMYVSQVNEADVDVWAIY